MAAPSTRFIRSATQVYSLGNHLNDEPGFWVSQLLTDYVRDRSLGFGNFGDSLGPLLVAAFSDRTVARPHPLFWGHRLITIGTTAHLVSRCVADLWGTGAPGANSPFQLQRDFRPRWLTKLIPHALRGPFSAALLAEAGYGQPLALGEPAWLLPKLWPKPARPPRHELGVIIHLSEAANRHPGALAHPEFLRYHVAPELADTVRIITTVHALNASAMRAKLDEMLDCRRILSTGLHGLVLAEAYGLPCAAFDIHAGQSGRVSLTTEAPLDHRVRDFYAGIGQREALVLRQERHQPTDWEAAIRFLDREWSSVSFDATPLLESFPARYGRLSEANFPANMEELQARLSRVMP